MRVLKFGGSSVADAERIGKVCEIVERAQIERGPVVVVCSALSGTTDDLLAMAKDAAAGDAAYLGCMQRAKARHEDVADQLLGEYPGMRAEFHDRFAELADILRGIFLVRECTPRSLDLVASFGERLSCTLVAAALLKRGHAAEFVDARGLIKTDARFGGARVDFARSNPLIIARLLEPVGIPVVTGFIGSTENGETTTLGRGGSDYTASILGAALGAEEVEIWTDVSGVMTADPRKVKGAFVLERMSYEEAMEMSHFGAKVIHPPTMVPVMEKRIPLRIKNTFAPEDLGTLILSESDGDDPIKGISSIDAVVLVRVEGPGMVGVPGVAGRVFRALAGAEVSVVLITQASSEHSICFAIKPEDAGAARAAVERELAVEIRAGDVGSLVVESDRAVVAVVGERMRQTPGIAASAFRALAEAGVNVVAVAQGSSERNVSIVVSSADVSRSLLSLHAAFFEPERVSVFLVGTGLVGSTLLGQLKEHDRFVVRGVMNSRRMLLAEDGLDPATALEKLSVDGVPSDVAAFLREMKGTRRGRTAVVDCTASEEVPNLYPELLRAGIWVVTSNKKGLAGKQELYDDIRRAESSARCLHETTVGAGLPIVRAVRDFFRTGDRAVRIEGVLSGTLSYLLGAFKEGAAFSALVEDARAKGYTEPDPRDDLSGADVARKLTILARELGWKMDVADVRVEPLLPEHGFTDEEMSRRARDAARDGKVLRYVGTLADGRASASLVAVGSEHPCFTLSGADNVFSVWSERYASRPMVIRGPGAGAEVTAAGVLADLYQV